MKRLSILGSTGSIGTQTLDVVDKLNKDFEVVYLSAHTNEERLIEQAKAYNPQDLAIFQGQKRPYFLDFLYFCFLLALVEPFQSLLGF